MQANTIKFTDLCSRLPSIYDPQLSKDEKSQIESALNRFKLQSDSLVQIRDLIASNPDIAKSGFNFVVDEKYTGNVVLLQKGADALTEAVNAALASSKELWDGWYEEAKSISGIDQSYDDAGNAIG